MRLRAGVCTCSDHSSGLTKCCPAQDRITSYGIGSPQRPEYPNAVYWCVSSAGRCCCICPTILPHRQTVSLTGCLIWCAGGQGCWGPSIPACHSGGRQRACLPWWSSHSHSNPAWSRCLTDNSLHPALRTDCLLCRAFPFDRQRLIVQLQQADSETIPVRIRPSTVATHIFAPSVTGASITHPADVVSPFSQAGFQYWLHFSILPDRAGNLVLA